MSEPTKNRRLRTALIPASAFVLVCNVAQAAKPTTAECLGASEAFTGLRHEHKLIAARSQLLICGASTCPAEIRKECLKQVDEINALLPSVVFSARDRAGADISAVRVTMDGGVLAERLDGAAISIDPGEHRFTFQTAGQSPITKTLVIVEGQKNRGEVLVFDKREEPAAPAAPRPVAPELAPALPHAETSRGLGAQKVLALVAGGLGVVGVGVGTVFGVIALSQRSQAQSDCPQAMCPNRQGSTEWSDAASSGDISTAALIAGGIAVAGAAVLWLSAPGATAASAQVGVGPGGLHVSGVF